MSRLNGEPYERIPKKYKLPQREIVEGIQC